MNKTMTFFIILVVGLFITSCNNAPKGAEAVTKAAEAVKKAVPADKTYNVKAGSQVMWTGSKLAGQHTGTLNITGGTVKTQGGKVTGGRFQIDMNSLTCTDLKAGEGKEKFEGHLNSPDFFDTANHSEATFAITEVAQSGTGYSVVGDLTIKGHTESIKVNMAVNGNTATTTFNVDRTKFGVRYGSASFFDNLKDNAISDNFELVVNLKF